MSVGPLQEILRVYPNSRVGALAALKANVFLETRIAQPAAQYALGDISPSARIRLFRRDYKLSDAAADKILLERLAQ